MLNRPAPAAAPSIRPATAADFDAMWSVFGSVIASGDTLPFGTEFPADTFRAHWFGAHMAYVAVDDSRVLGMYKLGANHADHGAHVATATYTVHADAHGRGIGRALVEHSLAQARREGFLAMQFNYVVSTNTRAIGLYQRLGFGIVGTLPRAFRHAQLGLVDAYVMHRFLDAPDA